MSIKERHFISNSELRDLIANLKHKFGKEVEALLDEDVETAHLDSGEQVILVDGGPMFIVEDNEIIPLIQAAERLSLKQVVVDMGAVKPIADGADVMAPGIVEADEDIELGDIVCVKDEENRKTIAIGKTLRRRASLFGEEGRVIENIHHVGDDYWTLKEEF